MKFERASGILLHPTSLPGPYGIGDLGPAAYRWVDFLAGSGGKLWQMLPLGPTGYGDSPYQCFSAFAGNPYLISPEFLLRDGLLHSNDLIEKTDFPDGPSTALRASRVDFGRLIPWKLNLLERAFIRFSSDPGPVRGDFDAFCAENATWLEDYALFMAIKEARGGGSWEGWSADLRARSKAALAEARKTLKDAILRNKFYQFAFFRQWKAVHDYAHQKGIRIIGDIPIFVAIDSADVWAHPDLFFLDEEGRPTVVAGVPPDYFSPTGQLWGNPLYRWEVHKRSGYAWWLERIRATLKTVDIVRIDHFRGFAGYWEVPAGNPTAEQGRWVPGPGADFFNVVQANLGDASAGLGAGLPIIAEDLGLITPDVIALREQFGLPGMKILQFAFSGPDNVFLPHHYPQNCVVYTGTHDNDTARGWYESAPEQEKDFARRYLNVQTCERSEPSQGFVEALIRACWASVAVFALAPMQDLLNLGSEARMNYPSRLGGNWEWRMGIEAMSEELQNRIQDLNYLYRR
jgi:4-alpha-glucanotransferase